METDEHDNETPVVDDVKANAIPVTVVGEKETPATFGIWTTYKLTGTEQAQMILPLSLKRHRAVIQVMNGFLNNNNLGYVLIGSLGQVQNGQGGVLVSGVSVTIESESAVFLAPDGSHALTVTVLEERYRS